MQMRNSEIKFRVKFNSVNSFVILMLQTQEIISILIS